jgi:hypothetical protein
MVRRACIQELGVQICLLAKILPYWRTINYSQITAHLV